MAGLVGDELARGFFGGAVKRIHADEPLRCCAVDDGRFVTPAMRVAVRDGLGSHQAVCVLQRFQNDGHGLPDVLATEQWEVSGVGTIALHGVQDVGVLHAVGHA